MKVESRKFIVKSPTSLLMFAGRLALWSRNESAREQLLWLNAAEAAALLQFSAAPRKPADVAEAIGIEYDAEFELLIDKLVENRILSEDVSDSDEPFYRLYSPGIKNGEAVFLVEPDALESNVISNIISGIITSGLVKDLPSPAGAVANTTQGFAVKFRRDSLDGIIKLMPWAQPYFDKILEGNVARYFAADKLEKCEPNAFYFSVLVVPPGSGTRLHVDVSLDERTPPSWVSVMYLETVPQEGLLYLSDANWPVGLINPHPGMLVHFRGDLTHGVTNTPPSSAVRLSLICEQYCLDERQFKQCPKLELVVN